MIKLGHPAARYFSFKYGWGGPPAGLALLFYLLYGERRTNFKEWRATNITGVYKWATLIREVPAAAAQLYSGKAFAAPEDWPDGWVSSWPTWVKPVHMLRAFGGRAPHDPRLTPGWKWTGFQGMPELAAYWSGFRPTREDMVLARRAAQRLSRTPQFTIYAYNVPIEGLRRHDLPYDGQAAAISKLTQNPLVASDTDVRLALPEWAWSAAAHERLGFDFDPLRTTAPDLLLQPHNTLQPLDGEHVLPLPHWITSTPMAWRKPLDYSHRNEIQNITRTHEYLLNVARKRARA